MEHKEELGYKFCICCGIRSSKFIPFMNLLGTYKFHHCKYRGWNYDVCVICMYLATNNKLFANYLSLQATDDENGVLRYKNNQWVIVHPSINKYNYEEHCENSEEYLDKIFCDM